MTVTHQLRLFFDHRLRKWRTLTMTEEANSDTATMNYGLRSRAVAINMQRTVQQKQMRRSKRLQKLKEKGKETRFTRKRQKDGTVKPCNDRSLKPRKPSSDRSLKPQKPSSDRSLKPQKPSSDRSLKSKSDRSLKAKKPFSDRSLKAKKPFSDRSLKAKKPFSDRSLKAKKPPKGREFQMKVKGSVAPVAGLTCAGGAGDTRADVAACSAGPDLVVNAVFDAVGEALTSCGQTGAHGTRVSDQLASALQRFAGCPVSDHVASTLHHGDGCTMSDHVTSTLHHGDGCTVSDHVTSTLHHGDGCTVSDHLTSTLHHGDGCSMSDHLTSTVRKGAGCPVSEAFTNTLHHVAHDHSYDLQPRPQLTEPGPLKPDTSLDDSLQNLIDTCDVDESFLRDSRDEMENFIQDLVKDGCVKEDLILVTPDLPTAGPEVPPEDAAVPYASGSQVPPASSIFPQSQTGGHPGGPIFTSAGSTETRLSTSQSPMCQVALTTLTTSSSASSSSSRMDCSLPVEPLQCGGEADERASSQGDLPDESASLTRPAAAGDDPRPMADVTPYPLTPVYDEAQVKARRRSVKNVKEVLDHRHPDLCLEALHVPDFSDLVKFSSISADPAVDMESAEPEWLPLCWSSPREDADHEDMETSALTLRGVSPAAVPVVADKSAVGKDWQRADTWENGFQECMLGPMSQITSLAASLRQMGVLPPAEAGVDEEEEEEGSGDLMVPSPTGKLRRGPSAVQPPFAAAGAAGGEMSAAGERGVKRQLFMKRKQKIRARQKVLTSRCRPAARLDDAATPSPSTPTPSSSSTSTPSLMPPSRLPSCFRSPAPTPRTAAAMSSCSSWEGEESDAEGGGDPFAAPLPLPSVVKRVLSPSVASEDSGCVFSEEEEEEGEDAVLVEKVGQGSWSAGDMAPPDSPAGTAGRLLQPVTQRGGTLQKRYADLGVLPLGPANDVNDFNNGVGDSFQPCVPRGA